MQLGDGNIQINLHQAHRRSRRRSTLGWLVAVACATAVLTTLLTAGDGPADHTAAPGDAVKPSGAGVGSASAVERPEVALLESARSECAPSASSVRIDDGGHTMIISRALAKKKPGLGRKPLYCLFEKLEMPASVVFHIENTTPLSGIRSADFHGLSAVWRYSPDDGLNMTVTDAAGGPPAGSA
ncbi:hypothetical protein [Micromonospora sediminicola]|uniref:hypothetical protein n=1 Tax=Micromonospora sediminicola TaxID=946078 RepID=UPI00339EC4E3